MIRKLSSKNTQELFLLDNKIFDCDKYSQNQITEELNQNSRIYFGWFEDGALVGFVGASMVEDESDIIKIGVEQGFRLKGIATKLFYKLKQELIKKNIKKIMLEVREKNDSAISFYLKLGFKKITVRKNYYVGDNAIILLMEI